MGETVRLDSEIGMQALDSAKQRLVLKYKNYNTIRRDLRTAHKSIERLIVASTEFINNGLEKFDQDRFDALEASFFHCISLYARWFKATRGKPMLDAMRFFKGQNKFLRWHRRIMEIRDKHAAHFELELFGGDMVFAKISDSGHVEAISSKFMIQPLPERQDLEQVESCINQVHNEIDENMIPSLERKLVKALRKDEPDWVSFSDVDRHYSKPGRG